MGCHPPQLFFGMGYLHGRLAVEGFDDHPIGAIAEGAPLGYEGRDAVVGEGLYRVAEALGFAHGADE